MNAKVVRSSRPSRLRRCLSDSNSSTNRPPRPDRPTQPVKSGRGWVGRGVGVAGLVSARFSDRVHPGLWHSNDLHTDVGDEEFGPLHREAERGASPRSPTLLHLACAAVPGPVTRRHVSGKRKSRAVSSCICRSTD